MRVLRCATADPTDLIFIIDLDNDLGDVVKIDKGSAPEVFGSSSVFLDTLSDLSRRITDMNVSTEEHFTSMGLKIQEYSKKAAFITDSALHASSIISGDDLINSIEGLIDMVEHLEDIFSRGDTFSDSNLGILKSIGWTVRNVEKEIEGLDGTSRDLKMLALSTKIQSTKTGGESSAFMQLGKDIAKMSLVISSNAGDLQDKTTVLSDFVRDVEKTLLELKEKQGNQTQSVLKWTRSIIEAMSDLNAKSKREAERIQLSSEKISQGVSAMVTSVQYQDISKQSLEKVIEGLKMIGDIPLSKQGLGNDPPTRISMASAQIQMTGHCVKQIHRMESTDTLVQKTLGIMVNSLETISSSIKELTDITNVVHNDCSMFLGDLETAMSTVTAFLKSLVQSNKEISDSINSLGQTVKGMTRFTEDIEMISSEVELISLNARIMAAQAGIEGAGMSVIADAVKETAVQADVQRNSVVTNLEEISRRSLLLNEEMKNATKSDEEKLDQLVRELGVFLETMGTMQKKIVSMLSEIDKHTGELMNAIKFSIDEIRDHFQLKIESADIAGDMKELALICSGLIKPSDLSYIAGDELCDDDLRKMSRLQRLELVETFFNEHSTDTDSSHLVEPAAGITEEDEVVIF